MNQPKTIRNLPSKLDGLGARLSDRLTEEQVGLLLVLPLVLSIVGLFLYPVIRGVWYSLLDATLFLTDTSFVGLANYQRLFSPGGGIINAIVNTFIYATFTVLFTLVIGVGTALLLNRTFKGKRWAVGLVLAPYLVPTVAVVYFWRWTINPSSGVVSYFLSLANVIEEPIAFLSSTRWAMPALIVISGWRLYPFVTLLVLAKLQTIPKSHYEIAETYGASTWQKFRSVTLPQLKGILFVAVLFRILWTFNFFDVVWIGTRGGPARNTETLPVIAYRLAFHAHDLGRGAAAAVVIFVILASVTLIYFKVFGLEELSTESSDTTQSATNVGVRDRLVGRVPLINQVRHLMGQFRWTLRNRVGSLKRAVSPDLTLSQSRYANKTITYSLLAVTILVLQFPILWGFFQSFRSQRLLFSWPPVIFDTTFTVENYVNFIQIPGVPIMFVNSILVAILAVIITLAIAVPAAYAVARYEFPGRSLVVSWSTIIYMFPYVLLAIPFFIIFGRLGLVNTRLGLAIPHAVTGLPFVLLLLTVFFLDIPEEMEESARIMGASQFTILRRVTIPLALPGIIAVAVWSALASWREFFFALIMMTNEDLYTLPVGIEQLFHAITLTKWGVMLAGLILLTVPPMLMIFWLQKYLMKGFALTKT